MRAAGSRLVGPVLILVVALMANSAWRDVATALGFLEDGTGFVLLRELTQAAIWMAGAFVLIRMVDILIWKGVVVRQTGVPATRLLMDLGNGVILITAVISIVAFVFRQPVTGLIATSSVAVAIVGFALKSLISDLFSGIAITLERPFRMGDWVEITGGSVGKVLNVSWRTTGLMLESGVYVMVPNGRLSEMILRLYDRPASPWRDEIDITLPYDTPPHQAERILIAAATDVPGILGQDRAPDLRIVEFGDSGTKWRLRFWVPDYPSRSRLRFEVQRNILRNLHFSGVGVPAPRIDAMVTKGPMTLAASRGAEAFLGRVSLFKMLEAEEIAELTAKSEIRLILAGQTLVQHGDAGSSLFLVKEGLCEVLVANGGGPDKSIAHLKPGAFFGEMSLLTGAPRSATVRTMVDSMVMEITRDALQPILARREAVVEAMSHALAERQLENDLRVMAAHGADNGRAAGLTLAKQLMGRMRALFALNAPAK